MKNLVKLVRDGIIERIRRKGEVAVYRQATDAEFLSALAQKLVEEAKELKDAIEEKKSRGEVIREAADIQESFDELLKTVRIETSEVMIAQIEKRRELGGFEGRWLLNVLF